MHMGRECTTFSGAGMKSVPDRYMPSFCLSLHRRSKRSTLARCLSSSRIDTTLDFSPCFNVVFVLQQTVPSTHKPRISPHHYRMGRGLNTTSHAHPFWPKRNSEPASTTRTELKYHIPRKTKKEGLETASSRGSRATCGAAGQTLSQCNLLTPSTTTPCMTPKIVQVVTRDFVRSACYQTPSPNQTYPIQNVDCVYHAHNTENKAKPKTPHR